MAKRKRSKEAGIDVEFGGVSIGESTVRLGMKIARDQLSITQADRQFVSRRLTLELDLTHGSDGQKELFDTSLTIGGVFDTKRLAISDSHYHCGLSGAINDLDIATIAKFAKRAGVLRISRTERLVIEEEDEHKEEE